MSRLCRLRNKKHGDDGQWAYREIVRLRAERDALLSALNRLAFAAECRDNTSGDAARLIEARAELAAAASYARAVVVEIQSIDTASTKGGAA